MRAQRQQQRSEPSPLPAKLTGVNPLVLGGSPLLSQLGTQHLVRLSEVAECRLVPGGDELFRQGDPADEVYLLVDGSIRLERIDDQRRVIVDGLTGSYDSFGDAGLLDEPQRRYTATATEATVVIALPTEAVREVLAAELPVAIAWRAAIAARLQRKEALTQSGISWPILEAVRSLTSAA